MGSLNQGTTSAAFTFQQSGIGAAVRTALEKMRDWVSAFDFIDTNTVTHAATIAAIQAGTSAYDCTADYVRMFAAHKNIYFPQGTFLGTISVLAGIGVNILGSGKSTTILKNNSVASVLVDLNNLIDFSIQNLTLDNNNVPANCLQMGGNYAVADHINIQNHGNATVASTYGFLLQATDSHINDVFFADLQASLYGGHLHVNQAFYSDLNNIVSGKAGTDPTAFALYIHDATGTKYTNITLEPGGGGVVFAQAAQGVRITNFAVESYNDRDASAQSGWFRVTDCPDFSINGVRWIQGTKTGGGIPIFYFNNSGAAIDHCYISRTVNSSVALVQINGSSTNNELSNFDVTNTDVNGITPVAYDSISITGGSPVPNLSIRNFYERIGVATHTFDNVIRGTIENVQGTISLINGSQVDGFWTTPAFAAGNFTSSGAGGWTVAAGNVTTLDYVINGRTMTVNFFIVSTTVTAPVGSLLIILLPASKIANKTIHVPIRINDNFGATATGTAQVIAGDAHLYLYVDQLLVTNWTASAGGTSVEGSITFEIQNY